MFENPVKSEQHLSGLHLFVHRALAKMMLVATRYTPPITTRRWEGLIAISLLGSAQKPGTPAVRQRK
ncbi:hypothetical protein P7K49_008676 [Saguinus oedipus]|uniref:Uncharacterized protein n=1 Tax=Saguinus oedipus TaxID=9490 RepID=A0ABQ9VYE0_SAGOE|nr:hypothetical protein P7K49_008676 [Saguinus oedipus]